MPRYFSIRHDISGRLRVRIPILRDAEQGERLRELLHDEPGVRWTRLNFRCVSLVVCYDPAVLNRLRLLELLREQTGSTPAVKDQPVGSGCVNAESGVCLHDGPCGERAREGALRRALTRFVAISVVTGWVVVRRTVFGAVTVQTATSPLGIATLLFTLPLARSGLRRLRQGKLSLDGFLAAGSVAATLSGEALTALEILWINAGAELLTTWISERSRKSIAAILEITSHHTFVLQDGVEVERRVEDLRPGDVVVLHTGEKVSVDGLIVFGQALLDESPLTGRAEPVHKEEGDDVRAGTFVREGVIQVRAQRVGDGTYLARVMQKVEGELANRAPIEGVADRLATRLVRLGLVATAATYVLTASAWRAFTVLLVMACPCATVLAASTAISAAINAAARRNVLIKGGRYLEEVGRCDTVFFDKTGTLTTTEPILERVVTLDDISEDELLGLVCSVETHNHHPLALALLREADRRGLVPQPHERCEYHLGLGMRAVIDGRELLVGNARLAGLFQADLESIKGQAASLAGQGLTVLYVFRDGRPLGLLGLASLLRPEAPGVLRRLRSMGVRRFVLITGDEPNTAEHLAATLGIESCHAGILPDDKARIVDQARRSGQRVMMVGDGINDALALTRADVGVALGVAGSEVAVEAADIALAADDLTAVAEVYALSQQTLRVVRQNFWLATGSNLVGLTAGAVGLLTPVTAGLVHVVHSLGVLANSSRLLGAASVQGSQILDAKTK
jgi:manganese/zinc-transporting P-type ATPase C